MQHILFFFLFFLFCFVFFWGGGALKSTTVLRYLKPASYNNTFTFLITITCHCNISCHFTLGSITQKLKIPFPLRSNSCWEALHLRTTFVVQSSCNAIFTFQVCSIPLTEIFFGLGGGEQNPPQFLGT